jgi:hypothetical protein
MRSESQTCHCSSTGAFRITVSPPANSNSRARMLKSFVASDKAVQAETDPHCTKGNPHHRDAYGSRGTCCFSAPERECARPPISPPTASPIPTCIPLWIIAAHGDEPLPLGVPAHATSNQLDRVARMLDAGGPFADARDLRLFIWVSCGAGV